MNKLYNSDNTQFIVYNQTKSNKKKTITVVFLHGLMSHMHGVKALYLENYCIKVGYNFIRFDNFGHGDSSGMFTDQTINSWLAGIAMVLEQLVDTPIIIVGSSLGGWLALILAQRHLSHDIIGIVGIATAADFTENSIWQKLSQSEQEKMQQLGVLEVGNDYCHTKYHISYNLITDARNYLLLNANKLHVHCPISLIHGMQDNDISYQVSIALVKKIQYPHVTLKLIKDGDHRLARIVDLEIIAHSINEVAKYSKFNIS